MHGIFLTFEGGEGAGKTTLMDSLAAKLPGQVLITREPGGFPLGEAIRTLLLHGEYEICPKAELMLFLAARAQHIEEVILPALEVGTIVLCDRFNDSTVAYQGGARGLGLEKVRKVCDEICDLTPHHTFFLDIDPAIGLKRAVGDGDRIENEKLQFHTAVREAFQTIAQKDTDRITVLDASQSKEDVFDTAWKRIQEML